MEVRKSQHLGVITDNAALTECLILAIDSLGFTLYRLEIVRNQCTAIPVEYTVADQYLLFHACSGDDVGKVGNKSN